MDTLDCKPSKALNHGRMMPSLTQRAMTRTPQPSTHGTRFSFTYSDLYQLLYSQRDVENVKLEDIKTNMSSSVCSEKKLVLKSKEKLASCETCRGHPKHECTDHGQLARKNKSKELQFSYAVSSFPDEVQLCWSGIPGAGYGVSAKQHIPIGTWIGPYEGRRTRPEEVTKEMDTSYMWEIFQDGRLVCYLDASDESTSSWMRFIRCARHRDEQNLYAFQYCGNIYYRAFRNIQVHQELLVWYDDKYQQHMGLPLNIQDMAVVDPNGNKLLFDVMACNVKPPITEQHPVTLSTPHVTQPLTVTATKPSIKEVSPRGTAARYHMNTHMCQSSAKTPIQSVTPVTQYQTVVTHCQPANVTHPIVVNCTTKYPIVVTAPVSTVVMETSSQKTNSEGINRKVPVMQSPLVTQSTCRDKQISPSKRKKLHDQFVPKSEVKHLKRTHGGHAHRENDVTHSRDIVGSDLLDDDEDGGERSMWNCGQCQRSFTQRALLQIHVCQGMPNRPYKCGHCADSFSQPNDLRTHVVKHTNEKPFKCGYCSRAFAGATTLNNHIRTHTGEKPFVCNKCRKMFSTASQLSRHQKTPSECTLKGQENQA